MLKHGFMDIGTRGMLTKQRISVALLCIVYTVGVVGLLFTVDEAFLSLTPANLLFSTGVLLLNHSVWNSRFILLTILVYTIGFFVEVAGVNYGFLFGAYTYGPVLGLKWLHTPLLIGLNWFMLVYATGNLINWLNSSLSIFVKAALGGLVMLLLDVLIEPVAIHYNFWRWTESVVPLSNYVGWYLVSYLLLLAYNLLSDRTINKVSIVLLILQFLFFGILNIFAL